jgi:AraC family transcriptional regulator, transcriptional activator of pobA
MRTFRPLLIDRANLRVPGLQISTFAVHRHLPEHASVAPHRHAWCQAIVYLSGSGEQVIGGSRARIEAGTMVLLPSGVPHAFVRRAGSPPLCVLVDFRLRGSGRKAASVCSLNRSEIAQLRQQVAYLMRLQSGEGAALRWEGAVPVLQVLLTLLRAAGWIERVPTRGGATANSGIGALLTTVSRTDSLADTIQRSGYQRDHLNRLVKKETGLTLGQYRAQLRLSKAKEMLERGVQIAHVGAAVGVPDQGYFARWFRRQTGQTPSAWRKRSSPPASFSSAP